MANDCQALANVCHNSPKVSNDLKRTTQNDMVFTSSSTHSDGKPLPMLMLDPYLRTEEMLTRGGTDAALGSVAHLESHFGSVAPAADAHS